MQKLAIVVGAGFGGLAAAKKLCRIPGLDVLVVDRRNYHLFQPLLYQVAMAGLSPAEIAVPIRSEFAQFEHCTVRLGAVDAVDLKQKTLQIEGRTIAYDYVVFACGAKHSYFGHNAWEEFAPGLKTLEQATEIRRRVFLTYEKAENEQDAAKRAALLTIVIVGAGPTGVELAGSIAEISRFTLQRDFRNIDPSRTRVMLIEAGPRILASFAPELGSAATKALQRMGVQVCTDTKVTDITADGVYTAGEFIPTSTVIWAAGVEPSSLCKKIGTELDRVGRLKVTEHLTVPGFSDAFVIGDMACCLDAAGIPLPGLSPVAMQQGRHVARQIHALMHQRPLQPFRYFDKGQMATIGRSKAVMQRGTLHMSGFIAWVIWLAVHVFFLVGFKNRFFVFLEWAWSYTSFKRGSRLILSKDWRSRPPS